MVVTAWCVLPEHNLPARGVLYASLDYRGRLSDPVFHYGCHERERSCQRAPLPTGSRRVQTGNWDSDGRDQRNCWFELRGRGTLMPDAEPQFTA